MIAERLVSSGGDMRNLVVVLSRTVLYRAVLSVSGVTWIVMRICLVICPFMLYVKYNKIYLREGCKENINYFMEFPSVERYK